MSAVLAHRVTGAISAGAEELLNWQRSDGAFTITAPASVLGTAGAITALHAADRQGSAELISAGATWLRHAQLPDGGWGGVTGARSAPVPTAIAAAALTVVGATEPVADGMRQLAELGGVAAVTDPAVAHLCRQFLALANLAGGEQLRRLPLEVVLFDRVRRQRVSFRTAPFVGLALLQTATMPTSRWRRFTTELARPRALGLLEAIHEHEGRTGAFSEDPWPAALVCLGLARAGLAPHLVSAIVGFLRRSVRPDGAWDAVANLELTRTGFAASGLAAAGYAADPRLDPSVRLLRRSQQREPFTVFDCPAGGWSYSGARGWPVTLESAEILTALATISGSADPTVRTGLRWLLDRQDRRGSWSLWVRDTKLANDGPCPAITSQGIEALRAAGHGVDSPPVRAAAAWLLTQQRPDGSYPNLWYRDHVSGTAMVLDGLVRAGHRDHPVARRAAGWLLGAQRADGSWGDQDGGTVEETAWAVHALVAADRADGEPTRRGVEWLLGAQRADGSWPAAMVCAYIRHHLHYPNPVITRALALRALGIYRDHTAGAGS